MKAHSWFIIGLLMSIPTLTHGLLTSFSYVHYILMSLSAFFIVGAFIMADAKEALQEADKQEKGTARPEAKKNNKILYYALAFVLGFVIYFYFKTQIIEFTKSYPIIWGIIQYVDAQIEGRTLMGLFYAAFFGSLFFIPLPVEAVFIYYLTLDYQMPLLIMIMIVGAILGELVNYLIGYFVGSRIMKYLMKENFLQWKERVDKYGGMMIFFASALPLPLGLIALIVGGMRFSWKQFIIALSLGRIARYLFIISFQTFIVHNVIPFLQNFF